MEFEIINNLRNYRLKNNIKTFSSREENMKIITVRKVRGVNDNYHPKIKLRVYDSAMNISDRIICIAVGESDS